MPEDVINRPSHYTHGGIESIDYIESWGFDFIEGNVIKYVTRYRRKNGLEDLLKARWYLERLIAREEQKACPKSSSPQVGQRHVHAAFVISENPHGLDGAVHPATDSSEKMAK